MTNLFLSLIADAQFKKHICLNLTTYIEYVIECLKKHNEDL